MSMPLENLVYFGDCSIQKGAANGKVHKKCGRLQIDKKKQITNG